MPEIKRRKEKKDELEQLREWVTALHRRFDAFFEGLPEFPLIRQTLWDGETCCLEAVGEIEETKTEIIATLDLPMVNKEDIEITTTTNQLEIKAKTRTDIQFERWGTIQRQLRFQSFSKTIPIPPGIDTDQIQASFKDGILQVRIPKPHKRKKIPIK